MKITAINYEDVTQIVPSNYLVHLNANRHDLGLGLLCFNLLLSKYLK